MEDSNITYEQLNDLSAEFDDAETELSKSAPLLPLSTLSMWPVNVLGEKQGLQYMSG